MCIYGIMGSFLDTRIYRMFSMQRGPSLCAYSFFMWVVVYYMCDWDTGAFCMWENSSCSLRSSYVVAWLQVNFVSVDLSSALLEQERRGWCDKTSLKKSGAAAYTLLQVYSTQCNKNSLCGTGFTPHAWQPAMAKTLRDILYYISEGRRRGGKTWLLWGSKRCSLPMVVYQ